MYKEHKTTERPSPSWSSTRLCLSTGLILFLFSSLSYAQEEEDDVDEATQEDVEELSDFSLEDLLDMEVTSVSKSAQPLSQAPAAIYVVTQDDIQRAGARSIPEALRLVPGIEVAQINRHRWAITSRGFNSVFASKMLVLMDGRTMYTPLFSGTFWNQQSTPVENIERIEVIRGPGATLWGANAVNGIINIITKKAKDALGGRAKVVLGTNNIEGYSSYGTAVGEDAYLRVYGQWFDRDDFVDAQNNDTNGDWDLGQIGFRLDIDLSSKDELTVQGDAYDGRAEQTIDIFDPNSPTLAGVLNDTIDIAGANMIARWSRKISEEQDFTLQIYVDRTERTDGLFKDVRNTYDLDFQHRFKLGDSHRFIWGAGYRYISDDFEGGAQIFAVPDASRYQIFNAFLQDEITLIENELKLILGSKMSHNDFSGFEVQPSIKMIWTPAPEHTVWISASRAVETPSRALQDLTINLAPVNLGGNPVIPAVIPSRFTKSTDLLAFELGYRLRPTDNLSFDLAVFYNDYERIATTDLQGISLSGGLAFLESIRGNKAKGRSYGLELSSEWRPFKNVRVSTSYSFIAIDIQNVGSSDPNFDSAEDASPSHRIVFRANWDITSDLEFNTTVYWNDKIRGPGIPSYLRLDLQLRWRVLKNLELAIGVRNLLDDRHPEFRDTFGRRGSEIERTAYFWMDFTF